MEVIRNARGGRRLIHQDHMYNAKKVEPGSKINWVCVKKFALGCRGSMTTDDPPTLVMAQKVHNHLANHVDVEVAKFNDALKESARNSLGAKTSQVLLNGMQGLSPEAHLRTPLTNSLKRSIQRQRQLRRPAEPATLADVDLVAPWTTTGGATQLPFLFHDRGQAAGNDRILVFGEDAVIDHLASSDTWYMDGNFKVSPTMFTQLYVIRAKLDDGSISCIYAFLPGKGQHLYTELFQALHNKFNRLGLIPNVRYVTCDFEQGAYNALRFVFGQNVRIVGCFFHLKQSTFRKAVELGLRQYIVDDSPQRRDDIRTFVEQIDAMAFVPRGHLNIAVRELRNNIPDPMVAPLLEYFISTYIEGLLIPNSNPPQYNPPMFPPDVWNMYQITLDGRDRTNNVCEGWNNGFNVLVGQRHPPLYAAIDALQKDYVTSARNLNRSQNGTPLTQVIKQNVRTYNRNVQNLCRQYQNNVYQGRMLDYLGRVSHNIRY